MQRTKPDTVIAVCPVASVRAIPDRDEATDERNPETKLERLASEGPILDMGSLKPLRKSA